MSVVPEIRDIVCSGVMYSGICTESHGELAYRAITGEYNQKIRIPKSFRQLLHEAGPEGCVPAGEGAGRSSYKTHARAASAVISMIFVFCFKCSKRVKVYEVEIVVEIAVAK